MEILIIVKQWKQDWWETAKNLRDNSYTNKQVTEQLNNTYGKAHHFTVTAVKRKFTNMSYQPKLSDTAISINADGSQTSSTIITMSKQQAKDPDFVLRAHGFDSDEWELVSATNNFWANKSQSKIKVKPITKNVTMDDVLNKLTASIKPLADQPSVKKTTKRNLVIPLADLHFGVTKYVDVERQLFDLQAVVENGYGTIVIEQLGDLFHSSQMNSSQTLKGTMLNEVDMEQAVEDAKCFYDNLLYSAIQNANHILVKHVGGNHSGNLEYIFMLYLETKFPNISVDKNIRYRTAYQLGNVGILIAHGDNALKRLPMLFATEYPQVWATSTYREQHTGHFHKQVVNDESGVVTRQFGTPKKADDYEIQNGYTMANHKLQALEYSQDDLQIIYNI